MSEFEDFEQSAASAEYDAAMAGAYVPDWAPVDQQAIADAMWDELFGESYDD